MSCKCSNNSIKTFSQNNQIIYFDQISQTKTCNKCPLNMIASRDESTCQSCFNVTISGNTGDCDCKSGFVILEKDINNLFLNSKLCSECAKGSYQFINENTPLYECKQCPPKMIYNTNTIPWSCECDSNFYVEFGGECFDKIEANFLNTQFPSSGASSVLLTDAETEQPKVFSSVTISESNVIKELYFKSGYRCLKEKHKKSCQTLANLCVLQMYNLQSEVCKLYKFINDLQPPIENMK